MSGSSAIQNIIQNAVSNGNQPNQGQVFGFPLTLIGAPITLDLKTLVNLHRVGDVQGIFMDNSVGTAALQVTTTAGQNIVIPAGSQGMMPLYLSADKTITFVGNGSIKLVLLNFPTPATVWSSTGGGSASVVDGQLLTSDGTSHILLSEIVTNTSGGGGGATGPFQTYGDQAASLKDVGAWNYIYEFFSGGNEFNAISSTGPLPIIAINSLYAWLDSDAYVTGGPYVWDVAFVVFTNNQRLPVAHRNFVVPAATGGNGGDLLKLENMNLRLPAGVQFRFDLAAVTGSNSFSGSGGVNMMATYAIID